jgi:hypothetical protein
MCAQATFAVVIPHPSSLIPQLSSHIPLPFSPAELGRKKEKTLPKGEEAHRLAYI